MPCHGFLFSLPRCGTEYVRTARQGCLNTLQHPFTPQLSPDAAPAAVFSGRGIIITRISRQPANAAHAGNAAHIFPSSVTIPCSTCIKALPLTLKQANISPRSSPLIIFQCSGCFVSLHNDILFRRIKTTGTFVVKVHCLPPAFIFIVTYLSSFSYRPARSHLQNR